MTQMIAISLPDGSVRRYASPVTGMEVARDIGPGLAKAALACRIDGELSDLALPISCDAGLEVVTARHEAAALELFRHDCAHILARAVQDIWPETKVTIGPVIENGFYYDFDRDEAFTEADFPRIEARMREIIALDEEIRREIWSRDKAIRHYRETSEPFKVELVEAIPDGEEIRMYYHGPWLDLCRGPHLARIGQIPPECFRLTSVAGAYWRGDSSKKMLQRIYGTAWRSRRELETYFERLEEARRRDHRAIGRRLDLFHFRDEAPGMAFWHPDGWMIWRELEAYMRRRLDDAGYVEVRTPQVVDRTLWERSGHWEKFREHMYVTEVKEDRGTERRVNALKPMNCPCHVQIYNQGPAFLAGTSAPDGGIRILPSLRAVRRDARPDARPGVRAGRRPYLLHADADRFRNGVVHRSPFVDLFRSRLSAIHDQVRRPASRSGRIGRGMGAGGAGIAGRHERGRPRLRGKSR